MCWGVLGKGVFCRGPGLFSRSYIVLRKYETADIGFSFTSPRAHEN